MDRKEAARRVLGKTTDKAERLELMILNELGPELLGELLWYIDAEWCAVGRFNTPGEHFARPVEETYQSFLALTIAVPNGASSPTKSWSIDLPHLVSAYGSPEQGAVMAKHLIDRHSASGDKYGEKRFLLAHHFLRGTDHHLKVALDCVEMALSLEPSEHSNPLIACNQLLPHRPVNVNETVHARLKPVVTYLTIIGIKQETIDWLIVRVLVKGTCWHSETVVAMAGAYRGHPEVLVSSICKSALRLLGVNRHFSVGKKPFSLLT